MKLLLKRLAWTGPAVRGGAEPPYRVCFARPIVCSGRDDCSGGGSGNFSSVILQGMSSRQKVLENGARQITAFHLAGDFCDLHTYVLKTLPDSVVAMTACEVAKDAIRRMHDADQPNIVQEVIAQRIISMARNGEDNRDRLCAGALKGART